MFVWWLLHIYMFSMKYKHRLRENRKWEWRQIAIFLHTYNSWALSKHHQTLWRFILLFFHLSYFFYLVLISTIERWDQKNPQHFLNHKDLCFLILSFLYVWWISNYSNIKKWCSENLGILNLLIPTAFWNWATSMLYHNIHMHLKQVYSSTNSGIISVLEV